MIGICCPHLNPTTYHEHILGRPKRASATKKKARQVSSDEDDEEPEVDDEEDDDEPLASKKKSFPSVSFTAKLVNLFCFNAFESFQDEEIRKYLKEVLDDADLEEITMKTVCKKVKFNEILILTFNKRALEKNKGKI